MRHVADYKKIVSLQGVRGLAILCIMVSHSSLIVDDDGRGMLEWLGAVGVEFFVILSGYLTCYWHLEHVENNKISSFKSAIYKMKKYYGLHVLTLLLMVPLAYNTLFVDCELNAWKKFASNLLLIHSWLPIVSYYFSFNAVSWYLSTVFFFLLMTPMFLRKLRLMKPKSVLYLMLTIVLLQWLFALLSDTTFLLNVKEEKIHWFIYVFPLVRYMDFVLGGGAYVLSKDMPEDKVSNKVTVLFVFSILAIIVAAILSVGSRNEVFSVAAWSIPCVIVISYLAKYNDVYSRFFKNKVLVFLGNISFELFLLHFVTNAYLCLACRELLNLNSIGIYGSLLMFALSVAISTIEHKYRFGVKIIDKIGVTV